MQWDRRGSPSSPHESGLSVAILLQRTGHLQLTAVLLMSRSSMLQRGRPAKRHEVPFWNRRGWCRSQIRASHQDQCSRTREHRSGACLSLLTNRSNAKEDRRTDWVTSILCLQCLRSRIHGELSARRDRQVGKEEIPIVTGRISLHATDDAFTSGSG